MHRGGCPSSRSRLGNPIATLTGYRQPDALHDRHQKPVEGPGLSLLLSRAHHLRTMGLRSLWWALGRLRGSLQGLCGSFDQSGFLDRLRLRGLDARDLLNRRRSLRDGNRRDRCLSSATGARICTLGRVSNYLNLLAFFAVSGANPRSQFGALNRDDVRSPVLSPNRQEAQFLG
ncbi:hypothetical protein Mnod_7713 (plasmid) [Methylobacterium nodulans ORS 2060]|uniref:Uncharacterized protein n=1 Tax=Methylobacterium nodulans (strain LMG 21967 / CNCM I-2342 / ORS 2060) TaxID=460265 RepID=B8IY16_METNO|nr:hypothetical protein Mnod_7713 [Methylobacterium nodulans ORS 2060]